MVSVEEYFGGNFKVDCTILRRDFRFLKHGEGFSFYSQYEIHKQEAHTEGII
jgi:hypothetical protein